MVNSKTKTALANLLSNRLQGNAGPESSNATSPISSSSASALLSASSAPSTTTQAMCPPPPLPVTSQSLPHSAPPPPTTQSIVLAQRRTLVNLTNGCKTIQVVNRNVKECLPGAPIQVRLEHEYNFTFSVNRAYNYSSHLSISLTVNCIIVNLKKCSMLKLE